MKPKRTAFFISDRTGITAESLGVSLISQFEQFEFNKVTLPYLDTVEKVEHAVARINRAHEDDGAKPLIFSTLVDESLRTYLASSQGMVLDFFQTFISPLEEELAVPSSHTVGRAHAVHNEDKYRHRINAVNFSLRYDDGANTDGYDRADIILVGVSRSGKTPTCLYLALQFGIYAANYPLTEEDVEELRLPGILQAHAHKLQGLTIDPEQLQAIRHTRRPHSRYASLKQCQTEIRGTEALFRKENINFLNTTTRSVEEIATTILAAAGIERQ